jgi:hypothetical protein
MVHDRNSSLPAPLNEIDREQGRLDLDQIEINPMAASGHLPPSLQSFLTSDVRSAPKSNRLPDRTGNDKSGNKLNALHCGGGSVIQSFAR